MLRGYCFFLTIDHSIEFNIGTGNRGGRLLSLLFDFQVSEMKHN